MYRCLTKKKILPIYLSSLLILSVLGCANQNKIIEQQCNYVDRSIKDFISKLEKPALDTIPSMHYTGFIRSVYLKIDTDVVFELIPNLSDRTAPRAPFLFSDYGDLPIKCIFLIKKGNVKKACGCKELARWMNQRHNY
jgi:hypothetical protein